MNRLSPTSRAATFYSTDPGVPLAELASPQALRYRRAPRAKATTHNRLDQSFLYVTEPRSFKEVATGAEVATGSYQVDQEAGGRWQKAEGRREKTIRRFRGYKSYF